MASSSRGSGVDTTSRAPAVEALYWALTTVSGCFLVLRFWCRKQGSAVGLDDWLMVFAWACLLAIAIMATYMSTLGGFRHLKSLAASGQLNVVLKILWATQPFGIIGIIPGKVAIGITLLRILGPTASKRFTWLLYSVFGLTVAIEFVTVFLQFFQCSPPSALWTPDTPAECLDPSIQADYAVFSSGMLLTLDISVEGSFAKESAWNALLDLFLALLPIRFIRKLNTSVRKRVGLAVLMGLGLLTCAAAVVKTTTLKGLGARSDITWVLYDLYVWQGVEASLVIILGSVPTMPPLLKRAFGQRKRIQIKASSYPTGGGFPKLSYPRHRLGSDTNPNLLTVEERICSGRNMPDHFYIGHWDDLALTIMAHKYLIRNNPSPSPVPCIRILL
ncbi:hypothetical protein VTN00DRAFT_3006 [Thermoascus crustaceus]|uniref:uncharacterized protein n=1 Tax=Thermoascus crustaceus TaxID=5088 RepID=UPI0037423348